jgi:hypothetical protein
MKFPSSLRGGVHGLEDAIITLSGPGIALSGIIAGVDLLTGGHAMSSLPWLTTAWAICLLLSLDFQVLALGARAHQVYLSDRSTGRKVVELVLSLVIAAAISYVSIQMQSIVAKMNASGLTIDQATMALGIDANALIFERSILVLVLIFLSGWFRLEARELATMNGLNQAVQWSQLEEWFGMVVQMNQGMLNQANEILLVQLAKVMQANQQQMASLNEGIGMQLTRLAREQQAGLNQLEQRVNQALAAQMNQQPQTLALAPEQISSLVRELSQGQQRQMETVFSRYIEQVFIRGEKPSGRQSTNGRLRAIPAGSSPASQVGELANQTEAQVVQGDGQPVQDTTTSLPNQLAGSEEGTRILNYLDQCQEASSPEPSLTQIEQACTVSHNTAIAWRRFWREKQAQLVPSGK